MRMDGSRISKEISEINLKLEKLDKDYVRSKISHVDYTRKRKALIVKKLWPLQRASLVLHNRNAYGYEKDTISLAEANRLDKKYPSGKTMTPAEIERHYGFKYNRRKK